MNCPHCGAPAQAHPQQPTVECRYCRKQFANPAAAAPPPPQQIHHHHYAPPPQPYPPQGQVVFVQPPTFDNVPVIVATGGGSMVAVAIGGVLLVAGVGAAIFFMRGNLMGPGSTSWDGKSPYSCSVNENVKFENVKATFTSGTAITAGGNCHVECVNCTIKAPTAAKADGNARIKFTGGTIEGTTTSFDASGNGQVEAAGDAKVIGPGKRSANGKIIGASLWDGKSPFVCKSFEDIEVENVTAEFTTGVAIDAGNCNFTCTNCSVKAPIVVKSNGNGNVRFIGGKLEGEFVAEGLSDITVSGNATAKGKITKSSGATVMGVTDTAPPPAPPMKK
ncbi:MAG: hypothetical protein U0414_36925 [Polyangiaceae bacterium]